jgi:hypothetical protein
MTEVQLKYQSHGEPVMEQIFIPSNWNELALKQLQFVAENWIMWQYFASQNMSLLKTKCQLLLNFLPGNKKQIKTCAKIINKLPSEDVYDLAQLTSFVFEKNDLTTNPIPVIKTKTLDLYPPSNKLANITAFEFSFAESQYIKYHNTGDVDALAKLIAILYRPKTDIDREEFNHKLVEKYQQLTSHLTETEKQMILLWYIGCRNYIVETHPEIFSKENNSKAENGTWIDVILAISGGKFGTFNQTGQMDLHIILKELKTIKKNKPKQ